MDSIAVSETHGNNVVPFPEKGVTPTTFAFNCLASAGLQSDKVLRALASPCRRRDRARSYRIRKKIGPGEVASWRASRSWRRRWA